MFNKYFLAAAVAISGMMFMGDTQAEAQNCYRGGGYGYAPVYRSAYVPRYAPVPRSRVSVGYSSFRGGGYGPGFSPGIGYGGFGGVGGFGHPGFYGRGTSIGYGRGFGGSGISIGFGF